MSEASAADLVGLTDQIEPAPPTARLKESMKCQHSQSHPSCLPPFRPGPIRQAHTTLPVAADGQNYQGELEIAKVGDVYALT